MDYEPPLSNLIDIAKLFGVSVDDLLLTDLSVNEEVTLNIEVGKRRKNEDVKEERNEEVKGKKGPKQPYQDCIVKDNYIAVKDELLQSQKGFIESLLGQIKLLQNQLAQKKDDTRESDKTQYQSGYTGGGG
jgi:hypothetical protein